MKTLVDHLSMYAAYHRDQRNIVTHLVGIPMIVLSIVVLLSRWHTDVAGIPVSVATVLTVLTCLFYIVLDRPLGVLMSLLFAVVHQGGHAIAEWAFAPWLGMGIGLFVVGWAIQFWGHYFEGKKPAFVDDITGLIIGPLFVVVELVFGLGMRRELRREIESCVGPVRLMKPQETAQG